MVNAGQGGLLGRFESAGCRGYVVFRCLIDVEREIDVLFVFKVYRACVSRFRFAPPGFRVHDLGL